MAIAFVRACQLSPPLLTSAPIFLSLGLHYYQLDISHHKHDAKLKLNLDKEDNDGGGSKTASGGAAGGGGDGK